MEILRDPEEKVICPYNNSHHIRKSRMEVHLKKCRVANSDVQVLVPCDFNTCHRVPQVELQYHHSTCPDKKGIELQVMREGREVAKVVTPLKPIKPVPIDDSWDKCDVPSYNAEQYCLENQVLRRLDTESALKRRNFRTSERQRIGHLTDTAPSKNKSKLYSCQDRENITNLPPTPVVSSPTQEKIPDEISDIMKNLKSPKSAILRKPKK
ncbi:gametocyte-specific factor 1 homolog [Rhynchophorus ferrugineus]|uniref:CHHC U11-48K-type domain-containing protein n=1 Tax=Rhynchophorus ferrugineus TaxID=354439 RepID=A0A834ISX1_RHYFE|nr:hypothetical protein GWI33_004343 [Rhynchophorus ferrugineus]